jgi:hypothetical protein
MLNGSLEVPIGAEREIRDLVAMRIRVIDCSRPTRARAFSTASYRAVSRLFGRT